MWAQINFLYLNHSSLSWFLFIGEAKPKKGGQPTAADTDAPVDISRLDMRVGKIVGVEKHPDADSLYVEQVWLDRKTTYWFLIDKKSNYT